MHTPLQLITAGTGDLQSWDEGGCSLGLAMMKVAPLLSPLPLFNAGAGHCSSCNPANEGYRAFWPALGAGSWQAVVQQAGHMQFTDAKGAAGWALDTLCGAGPMSHEVRGCGALVQQAGHMHFR